MRGLAVPGCLRDPGGREGRPGQSTGGGREGRSGQSMGTGGHRGWFVFLSSASVILLLNPPEGGGGPCGKSLE